MKFNNAILKALFGAMIATAIPALASNVLLTTGETYGYQEELSGRNVLHGVGWRGRCSHLQVRDQGRGL